MEKTFDLGEISKTILDDIIDDHVLVCDLDGHVLCANKSMQSYLGYAEVELKAINVFDLIAEKKLHVKIFQKNNYIYIYGNQRFVEYERLKKKLDSEITKAIKIHKRSLPDSFPNSESISFSSLYIPAEKLGGDLYDVFKVDNGLLNDYFEQYVCYIADVSGHGLDSAMLAIFIKDTIRSYFRLKHIPGQLVSPKEIMDFVLEQYTLEGYPDEYLVCLFLTVIDLKTNELTYCNAGFHKSPLLIRDGNSIIELNNGGFPISAAIDSDLYNFKNYSHQLTSAMTLFIMSDGLSEQKSNKEEYEERLKNLVTKIHCLKPDDIVQKIYEDFNDFLRYEKISDDITLIVVKIE